jgi:hypothetical protein
MPAAAPQALPPRRSPWPWVAVGAALLVTSGVAAWTFSPGASAPPTEPPVAPAPPAPTQAAFVAPPASVAPPAPPEPAIGLPLADPTTVQVGDEAAILAQRSGDVAVFRLQPDPQILVLVFPTLHEQGLVMNRIGAMVEKAGMPRDRVSSEAAMDYSIARSHGTADTYYSGHDYRETDIRRFFALARAGGVALRPEEEWLRALLDREQCGAVVSLTEDLDEAARATILRHELSHGVYFTSKAYAAYARRFWERELTEDDRAHFRAFLAAEDYDETDEDLMLNETQAYLVHTADRRFFNAAAVGLPEARIARLRGEFVRDMPPGWLRDRTQPTALPPLTPAAARSPGR